MHNRRKTYLLLRAVLRLFVAVLRRAGLRAVLRLAVLRFTVFLFLRAAMVWCGERIRKDLSELFSFFKKRETIHAAHSGKYVFMAQTIYNYFGV